MQCALSIYVSLCQTAVLPPYYEPYIESDIIKNNGKYTQYYGVRCIELPCRQRKFTYEEITARDKTSLDTTWLKDKSLADLDNLPDPDELAEEIVENLESALDGFKVIITQLKK